MKRHLFIAVGAIALFSSSVAFAAEGEPSGMNLMLGIGAAWLVCLGAAIFRPRIGVAIAGLLGLGVSLYLGLKHGSLDTLICDVNNLMNCSAVLQSEHSTLFGIPIAFFGSGFYAAAVAAGVMALVKPKNYHTGYRLLLAGAGFSVLYSVFLAMASKQVGAWCPFCISLYGFNVILFVASILWSRTSAPEELGDDWSINTMLSTGAVIFIASVLLTDSGDTPDGASMESADLTSMFQAPEGNLTLDGTEPQIGSSSAPYVLVEFADFECPACSRVAPELKILLEQNDDIQMFYKNYPISNICNENISQPAHTNACGAAMAAECANQQQRFWELSRLMFKNQTNLTTNDQMFMAKQVGLDMDAFQTCMDNPLTEASVRADVAHATEVGVHGTPALYLKGVKGDEWIHIKGGPDSLIALVEAHRAGIEFPPTPPAERH
jgi:protein-disulfide isomerase/uncharacterized membrane protein